MVARVPPDIHPFPCEDDESGERCPHFAVCAAREVACIEFGNWALERHNSASEVASSPNDRRPTASIFKLLHVDDYDDFGGLFNPLTPPEPAARAAACAIVKAARRWDPPIRWGLAQRGDSDLWTQAEAVLSHFGGPQSLSRILAALGIKRTPDGMYHWLYSSSDYPSGGNGLVPSKSLALLVGLGRYLGHPLPDDVLVLGGLTGADRRETV